MYQVPNFDNTNAELLAEWIVDEYKHVDLEIVRSALHSPPRLNDQAWRLTPDTLTVWIEHARIKGVDQKMKNESSERQGAEVIAHPITPQTEKMVKDAIMNLAASIKSDQINGVRQEITRIKSEDKVRQNGRKSESIHYQSPTPSQVADHDRHIEWIRANYDSHTGKPKSGWVCESQWVKV